MSYDERRAIHHALRMTRPGAMFGGAMAGGQPAAQGNPDAAGAPAKGFQPDGGQQPPMPTAQGSPDAAGAPPKGFQPEGQQSGGPAPPAALTQQYAQNTAAPQPANMYESIMSRMPQAPRTYQPTDFAAPERKQWQFDPATDPSRMLNAQLRRQAEEKAAAAANQTPSYGEQGVPSWDYGNGG